MDKRLASHFQYRWWLYLVVLLLAVILWTSVFSNMAKPKDNEKVSLIVFSDQTQWTAMQEDISKNIGNITAQNPIKQVGVERQSCDLSLMPFLVDGRLALCDLFIIAESVVTNTNEDQFNPTQKFRPMQDKQLTHIFGDYSNLDLFSVGEYTYGVYLNNPNDDVTTNFEKYLVQDFANVRYVLFFSYYSANLNQLYGEGKIGDSVAIDVANYLVATAE